MCGSLKVCFATEACFVLFFFFPPPNTDTFSLRLPPTSAIRFSSSSTTSADYHSSSSLRSLIYSNSPLLSLPILAFHSPPVSPSHRTDEDLINKSLLDSINADVDTSTTATRLSPASQHSHLSYDHQQVSSSSLPVYPSRNSLDIMSPSSTNHPNPGAPNYPHFQQPTAYIQYPGDSFNYPTKADIFGPSSNDRYDFVDPYQDPALAHKHVASYSAQLVKQQQSQSQQSVNGIPYLNGAHIQNGIAFSPSSHHHHPPTQHPLLQAPGPGSGSASQQSSSQHVQPPQQQSNRGDQAQEEISTIFVVGFPDDMQEREFQNMFTFANGFEAATLKIPNKDSSAYGSAAGASGVTNSLRQAGYLNQQHPGSSAYSGAQDPYNLVTVNSGGVVVDGPQGTSSSWQQANSADSFGADSQQQQQQQQQIHPPPRKQIIGFAKFRTRQEALEARDVLQGRRVDIEKGAVLKAEMAKKNLHTKRGVGPLGLPVGLIPSTSSANANVTLSGVVSGVSNNLNLGSSELSGTVNPSGFGYTNGTVIGYVSSSGHTSSGESLVTRDRQPGTLDAPIGLGANALNRRQHQQQGDEKEHDPREKRGLSVSTATSVTVTRDEPEHEQVRRERSAVYDAFHSVSDTSNLISSAGGSTMNGNVNSLGIPEFNTYSLGNGLHSNNNTVLTHGSLSNLASKHQGFSGSGDIYLSPQSHHHQQQQLLHLPQAHNSTAPGTPWNLTASNANVPSSSVPPRPPSSSQSSPPSSFDVPYSEKRGTYSSGSYTDPNEVLSPPDLNTPLPLTGGSQILRLHSPGGESNGQHYQHIAGFSSFPVNSPSSLPRSSSSSVIDGSQGSSIGSLENEFSKVLLVSTESDMASPQLPSPESRASSAGGPASASTSTLPSTGIDGRQASNLHTRQHYPGNASDHNPPINTLYVGNLPNSPVAAGYSSTVLEDSLRSLFSQCPGYRKLCFRQKTNGPMCFVEFEDVDYATKAMRDLYGNPLNGLVKGGIRLSFSKNPLGVRPSNPNGQSQNQRQQTQPPSGSHQSQVTVSSNSMNFSSMHDAFQNRAPPSDIVIGGNRPILRHYDSSLAVGATELHSPNHIYSYSISPPPTSRFFSPPPSSSLNAVGLGPGQGVSASVNVTSSSMSSASSTSSASGASSSLPMVTGSSFPNNMRPTAPSEFGGSALSPTLSAQTYSPSFGMNLNAGVLSSALESDDRAVRFARSPPISSTQIHSFGFSGSSLASFSSASSSNGAVSPGLQIPSLSPKK